jgi:hypothetical protein
MVSLLADVRSLLWTSQGIARLDSTYPKSSKDGYSSLRSFIDEERSYVKHILDERKTDQTEKA